MKKFCRTKMMKVKVNILRMLILNVGRRCMCSAVIKQNRIKTFPQIYFDDKRIGGYKELKQILSPKPIFDYDKLHKVVKTVTKNLNKITSDINYYPIPETERSNKRYQDHQVIVGVQGLADVFALLKIPFNSSEAAEINEKIFETIYFDHGGRNISQELSKKRELLMNKYKSALNENNTQEVDKLYEELLPSRRRT